MSKVSQVQKKVQSILSSELGSVNVDADGNSKLTYESTALLITTFEFGVKSDETVIGSYSSKDNTSIHLHIRN